VDTGDQTSRELLSSILRDVSRTFYKTLGVLPAGIRPQMSLAYLLARTTDTIADTGLVPPERRLEALQALRERILGSAQAPLDFGELIRHQGAAAERVLLERCEASLALLQRLSPGDQQRVREVLQTITSGQELDLRRFAGASASHLIALRTAAELEDYTYRVAGCVGEFWTKMCRAHLFPEAPLDEAALVAQGVRFGQGLQLVNILRDLPADLRQGRCYLPAQELAAQSDTAPGAQSSGSARYGGLVCAEPELCAPGAVSGLAVGALKPEDLLEPANEPRLRPVYNGWLDRAEAHLRAGWAYTNALPRGCVRVRLACAWPLLIGLETLKLLRTEHVLDPRRRIKVSRWQVRRIRWRSVLYYPWPAAWRGLVPNAPS
jgi:farnesyl-diphosphate farnesyltransferase